MRKIKTAVIGCGKVGQTHAKAYQKLETSELVGFYDTSFERALEFANDFSADPYSDFDQLLKAGDIEAISICTPHYSHSELAIKAVKHGIHVLIEKPMAIDLDGCDDLIKAANQAGVKVGVISQRRYYPPVIRMKKAIEDGKIGKPILGLVKVLGWRSMDYYKMDPWRGRWASEGGGVLLTQATHQLDLFQWFMGPISELMGYWGNLNHPGVEVEDTAVAVMKFQSGALGVLAVSNSQNPGIHAKIQVFGDNGAGVGVQTDGGSPFISGVTVDVDPPLNDLWTIPDESNMLGEWQAADKEFCQKINVMEFYHLTQIEDFLEAIINDKEPAVSGIEGRKHVELFTAIYRSQYLGHPVKFPLSADGEGSDELDGRLDLHNRKSGDKK